MIAETKTIHDHQATTTKDTPRNSAPHRKVKAKKKKKKTSERAGNTKSQERKRQESRE
jgi:hypothetical protein